MRTVLPPLFAGFDRSSYEASFNAVADRSFPELQIRFNCDTQLQPSEQTTLQFFEKFNSLVQFTSAAEEATFQESNIDMLTNSATDPITIEDIGFVGVLLHNEMTSIDRELKLSPSYDGNILDERTKKVQRLQRKLIRGRLGKILHFRTDHALYLTAEALAEAQNEQEAYAKLILDEQANKDRLNYRYDCLLSTYYSLTNRRQKVIEAVDITNGAVFTLGNAELRVQAPATPKRASEMQETLRRDLRCILDTPGTLEDSKQQEASLLRQAICWLSAAEEALRIRQYQPTTVSGS